MRTALIGVFLALTIHNEGSGAASDDFRPTPIPLNDWHDNERENRAGTLHEAIKTEAPPAVAAVPAHYWEDALRHSVYLTLVRDKIDQLIAKGEVISPSTNPNQQVSKEVDDHDLWEKIKTAPFDRIAEEDPSSFGDVAIMAKGRLLEDKSGFRFTEDERSKEKCADEKCMEGVKAIWSVKRIRQRDHETSPGRYHYELTFSVISQTPKKQRKPHENPIRTFTVRESTPDRITEAPQEHKKRDNVFPQAMRPERAVWVHRNIVPPKYHLGRSYYHGLDRIFSSLFSDDDDEIPPESTARHKSNSFIPPVHPPYSKTGYVGAPTDQHQQNVKYTPYPYKQPVKYSRPLPAPPIPNTHHYLEGDSAEIPSGHQYPTGNQYNNGNHYPNGNQNSNRDHYNNGNQYTNGGHYTNTNQYINGNNHYNNGNPHTLQSDYKVYTSNKAIRTTRPAVLPTPLPPVPPTREMSFEISNVMKFSNETTHIPETITVYKNYNKFRSPSSKINYFSEHVRPPIYNAPPGVFTTMDKKPFKPMPPLKLIPTPKPHRNNRPIDFRPSPQILEGQSTEKDTFIETAFRPITAGYPDSNSTRYIEVSEVPKKGDNKLRKTNAPKKPSKKNENTKLQKLTTNAPEIITAATDSEEDIDTMEWANILNAFTKTTPMASTTEKIVITETEETTPMSTTETTADAQKKITTTEAERHTSISTSTTPRPKKRTRPPPKFAKQDKTKKHKRVTTNSTLTIKPIDKSQTKRLTKDLIPQASSAAVGSTKSLSEISGNKTATTTPMTTTTSSTSPSPATTITAASTGTTTSAAKHSTITPRPTTTRATTTATTRASTVTTGTKNRNRFRQSTLMLKGTSVKHDKWSSRNLTTSSATSATHRRKGSNFQGYLSSPMPSIYDKEIRNRHPDRVSEISTSSTTEISLKFDLSTQPITTKQINEETDETTADHNQDEEYDESEEEKNQENTEEESKDHTEFIFQATTQQPSEHNNEEELEENVTSDQIVETTPHAIPKNKTKCKKKKPNTESNEEHKVSPITSTTTTTEKSSTTDILKDLFDLNFGSTSEKDNEISSSKPELNEEESENHEKYLKVDDDFKEFLDNLGEKHSAADSDDDDQHYDDDDGKEALPIDDEDTEIGSESEQNSGRHTSDNYEDYQDRPYSFLELLAME